MPATKFLDVPGGRIAYDDTGEGPLIVCTPAMLDLRLRPSWSAGWCWWRRSSGTAR